MITIDHITDAGTSSMHLTEKQHRRLTTEGSDLDSGLMPAAMLYGVVYYAPPKSSTSPGKKGMQAFDENYYYLCFADNMWRRVPLEEVTAT